MGVAQGRKDGRIHPVVHHRFAGAPGAQHLRTYWRFHTQTGETFATARDKIQDYLRAIGPTAAAHMEVGHLGKKSKKSEKKGDGKGKNKGEKGHVRDSQNGKNGGKSGKSRQGRQRKRAEG